MFNKKKIIAKLLLLFGVGLILLTINGFAPVIGASFSVDQLQDTYSSSVGTRAWVLYTKLEAPFFILLFIILFFKEAVLIIRKINQL